MIIIIIILASKNIIISLVFFFPSSCTSIVIVDNDNYLVAEFKFKNSVFKWLFLTLRTGRVNYDKKRKEMKKIK